MKKFIAITLTAALISTLVLGCQPKQKPSPAPQSSSAPSEQSVQPVQSVPASKPEEPAGENNAETPKIEEATGIYNGMVDTNFIEVKLDGADAPIEFSIMEITGTLKGFNKNDKVKITYIVNEDKQHILKSIEKVK